MKISDYVLSFSEKKKKVYDKEILRKIKILVPAQSADVRPPLGPTLGQFGINIKDFCDKFNVRTKNFDQDVILSVNIILFLNKNYNFFVKMPSAFFFVNEEDFFSEDSSSYSNYVFLSSFYKIVCLKSKDFGNVSFYAAINTVLGTLRSSDLIFVNDVFK